jgi:aspartate aminotransferase
MTETASMKLSARVSAIGPSATLAASEKAAQLRAEGVDVLDLGPGQPDFETPEHIRNAGVRAIREGRTRYTPAAGIPDLREAVADLYTRREGVSYRAEETIVTAGGKQGLFNVFAATLDPGDEVILPTPYWVSFPEQIKLTGATPVPVHTDEADGFALRAEQILDACTDRTRMVVLNTPSNPSGAVMSRDTMLDLAGLALERGIYLLVDECYAALVYEGAEHVTPLAAGPEVKDLTILCGSCSKSYAMTGWRIGYVAAAAPIIQACARLQGHSTSNATSISQYAALEALTGDQTPVRKMLNTFAERRDAVLPRIREIPGVTCVEPQGAFYAFPNVSALLGGDLPTAADLAAWLIDEAHVVTVPGTAFGRDGFLRLSYATSMEILEESLDRITAACEQLMT